MQNFDIALKDVLKEQFRGGVLADWFGFQVSEWLQNELPEVRGRRVDLLGRTADGGLVHIEVQSQNDPDMPLRMAEYALGILRTFASLPRQIVLYVGYEPLRMPDRLIGEDIQFRYRAVDIRELDAEPLIESERVGDNVLAILARLRAQATDVKRILDRIAGAPVSQRERALRQLTILAGLRRLRSIIETETNAMPVVLDIMDHDLFGPVMREGIAKGMKQGIEQGMKQGLLKTVRKLAERRFGKITPQTEERLLALSAAELEGIAERILDAESLDDLFSPR